MDGRNAENEVLNGQRHHWEKIFTKNSEMFGTEPSYPARKAAELFKKEDKGRILEPGGLNFYTVRNTTDAHYQTGIHRSEDMWEIGGGFIVHFFSKEKIEHLSKGYEIVNVEEFEEGDLPKKLFMVTLRKESVTR
jgi:hypothetical protein